METTIKIENEKAHIRRDSILYSLTPDKLFDAVHAFLNGKEVIRANNITELHDYLIKQFGAGAYELSIEWREAGDNGNDDWPESCNLDL